MDFSTNYTQAKPKCFTRLCIAAFALAQQANAALNLLSDSYEAGDITVTAFQAGQHTGIEANIFSDSFESTALNTWTATAIDQGVTLQIKLKNQLEYPIRSAFTILNKATFPDPFDYPTQVSLQLKEANGAVLKSQGSYDKNIVLDLNNNQVLESLAWFDLTVTPYSGLIQKIKLERFLALREYYLNTLMFEGGASFYYFYDYSIGRVPNELIPDLTTFLDSSPYSNSYSDDLNYCTRSYLTHGTFVN